MYLMLALGAITLVMAYLGYHLSITPAESRRAKFIYRAAFVVCGFISLVLIGIQGHQADQSEKEAKVAQQEAKISQDRLNATMDRLGTQTSEIQRDEGEIKRVQGLNTELQNKLLDQSGTLIDSSKKISELSKQGIETVTGGKSFCFIVFRGQGPGKLTPVIIQMGNKPLYDVHARIIDIRKSRELERQGVTYLKGITQFPQITLASMPPNSALPDQQTVIEISNDERQDFVISFDARNGFWSQQLQLRKVGNEWTQALRVFRLNGEKYRLIYTDIPKEFPLRHPDWAK